MARAPKSRNLRRLEHIKMCFGEAAGEAESGAMKVVFWFFFGTRSGFLLFLKNG